MTLHCLEQLPEPRLAGRLMQFEQQFDYPLGPQARFRISHSRDYLPFFQAMGQARIYVIEHSGEIQGTLAHVERFLEIDSRPGSRRLVHYLCDLKIAPAARGGRVLAYLMREAKRHIAASSSHACYSVVMAGTGRLPTDYTGRIGVPAFPKIAEVVVLRISPPVAAPIQTTGTSVSVPPFGIRVSGGDAALRSILPRTPLVARGASGCLEDTRRGKKLWDLNGEELLNAHVSDLRFETPQAAADLLGQALQKALRAGFGGVFFSLPAKVWNASREEFAAFNISEAPAVIHGYGLPPGGDWWINSAEI